MYVADTIWYDFRSKRKVVTFTSYFSS